MQTESYFHDTRYPCCPYTLPQIWEQAANRDSGSAITWVRPYEKLTHKQLYHQAMVIAKGLLALGLKKGDTLCCFGSQGSDPVLMFLACSSLGIIFMSNFLYTPVEKVLKMVLTRVKPTAVMVGNVKSGSNLEHVCSKLIDAIGNEDMANKPSHIIYDRKAEQDDLCRILDGWESLHDIMELGKTVSDDALQSAKALVGLNEPCLISCSSGSTGESKLILLGAACLTNLNIGTVTGSNEPQVVTGMPDMALEEITLIGNISVSLPGDKDLVVLPLMNSTEQSVIIEELLNAIEKYRIGLVYYDQVCIAQIVNNAELRSKFDLSSLKCVILAGSLSTQEFKSKLLEFAAFSMDYYSCTEFFKIVSPSPGLMRTKPGSVGQPAPNVETKIIDDNGDIVPINTRGQLCVRGPFMFLEYKDQPELTAQAMDKDDWYMTGDLVSMDELGYLYVYGRISTAQRWKVEGDVVYSTNIESVLRSHPKVRACAVVGTQGEGAAGHQLNYVIIPVPGSNLQPNEIKEFAVEKMCSFVEWPVRIFLYNADQLPRTSGARKKLNRGKLEEEIISRVKANPLEGLVVDRIVK